MKGISEGKLVKQKFSLSRVSIILAIIFSIEAIFSISCTKISEFTIGKDFVESQTKLTIIDTFKVDLSTIVVDSVPTSATKIAFIGSHKDNTFGAVTCKSYFDLAFQTFTKPDDAAIFDSAAITLVYSKYSYGDTTSSMTISVHGLTEKISSFVNGYLYNNSSFGYSPEALGTLKFFPGPHSSDTLLRIHVDSLGAELFQLIKDNDVKVSTQEWFSDYLKGFVITSDSAEDKSVLGFKADNNHLKLMVYYHLNKEEVEKKEISITMGSASHQFNNIRSDLTNTPLAEIKSQGNILSSDKSDNKAFMQGLTAFLPKLQFPTIQNLFLEQNWKILKAELVIRPVRGSFEFFGLPKNLYLYDTDRNNSLNGVLNDSHGNPLTAAFHNDELYNEDTRYTFDITTFINNELSDSYFDYRHGLLIGLQQSKLNASLDRLVVEGSNPAVKLRIYYLSY